MEPNVLLNAVSAAFRSYVDQVVLKSSEQLRARVAALENIAAEYSGPTLEARVKVLEALEAPPLPAARGVEEDLLTQVARLRERCESLETKLAEAALFTKNTEVSVPVDEARMVEALNSQEWFWEKLSRFVADNSSLTVDDLHGLKQRITALEDVREAQGALTRSDVEAIVDHALDNHCETYDHDQYDEVYNEWGGESPDEFVKDSDIEDRITDTVNDTLRNATFSISI